MEATRFTAERERMERAGELSPDDLIGLEQAISPTPKPAIWSQAPEDSGRSGSARGPHAAESAEARVSTTSICRGRR